MTNETIPTREAARMIVSRTCDGLQNSQDESWPRALTDISQRADRDEIMVSVAGVGVAALLEICGREPSSITVAAVSGTLYPRVRELVGCSHSYFYDRLSELAQLPDAQAPQEKETGERNGAFDVFIPMVMACLLRDNVRDADNWHILDAYFESRATGDALPPRSYQ